MKYFAFCDPSGGSSDSMTLAIARRAILSTKAILCGAWERKAPFNPDAVTAEFAGILREYRLTTVTGDRYIAEWVKQRFAAHEISYVPSEKTKSEILLEFLALVNAQRVRIPSNKRLRAQLVALERHTSRSGRDKVDHPPGAASHDDVANACAGALVLAAAQRAKRQPRVWVLSVPRNGGRAVFSDERHPDEGDNRWYHQV